MNSYDQWLFLIQLRPTFIPKDYDNANVFKKKRDSPMRWWYEIIYFYANALIQ